MAKHRLVSGVMEIVSALVEDAGSRGVESMADVNRLVVEKIAREFVSLLFCAVCGLMVSFIQKISYRPTSTVLCWTG